MLQFISIRHFILISSLDLDIKQGLTVITGETGSGKSMIFNAIAFALGEKIENITQTPLQDGASVTLFFDIHPNHPIRETLQQEGIHIDDELIIRRSVTGSKRSRIFINDCPVTQKIVKTIEPDLILWQRQHAYIKLFDAEQQMAIVDQHITPSIIKQFHSDFQKYQEALKAHQKNEQKVLSDEHIEQSRHYLRELENVPTESIETVQTVFQSYDQLQNEKQILENFAQMEEQSSHQLTYAHTLLQICEKSQAMKTPGIEPISELAHSIDIQLEELGRNIRLARDNHLQSLGDRDHVESHVGIINDLARKHRLFPEELPELRAQLTQQLYEHEQATSLLAESKKTRQEAYEKALASSEKLHQNRLKTAVKLQKQITHELRQVGLEQGQFSIEISRNHEQTHFPKDCIQFLASMNPQLPQGPLKSTLSGGELSRLALIINLLCPFQQHTLLMDEVDTGISGLAATRVGNILRQVASQNALLCITHTAQVAAHGQNHWHIQKEKSQTANAVSASVLELDERAKAIAKLIGDGGSQDTALTHAQSLLDQVKENI